MTEELRDDEETKEFREESESLWRIALGPLIWAAHFVVSYTATAVVCAKLGGAEAAALRTAIGLLTVLALAGIVWVGWRAWRSWDYLDDYDHIHDQAVQEHRHEFLGHACFLLAVLAFIGVIYTALPAVFVAGCA